MILHQCLESDREDLDLEDEDDECRRRWRFDLPFGSSTGDFRPTPPSSLRRDGSPRNDWLRDSDRLLDDDGDRRLFRLSGEGDRDRPRVDERELAFWDFCPSPLLFKTSLVTSSRVTTSWGGDADREGLSRCFRSPFPARRCLVSPL